MKYPASQFDSLISILKDLSNIMALKVVNPSALHFTAYQQVSKGQTHNWFYSKDGHVKRAHQIGDLTGWEKVVKFPTEIELYPDGCNDPHIETAVKKAIKLI